MIPKPKHWMILVRLQYFNRALMSKIIQNIQKGNLHQYQNDIDKNLWLIVQKSINSVLMILSEEHGTAVCISKKGHILTCQHCVGRKKKLNLISKDGKIITAKVIFSDKLLDLALLIIQDNFQLSFSTIALQQSAFNQTIFCIGNPAYDDLQSKKPRKTSYKPFYVSQGTVEGYTEDKVYGDKKKGLGPLKHNCWTYWGHSGAPIFNRKGQIIGIHNSWDDQTAIRHGLSYKTLQTFLEKSQIFFKNEN